MLESFATRYDHAAEESKLYEEWEKSGIFNPDICIKKKITGKNSPVFSMVLPPPNVTGNLHLGHAAMLAIEDILARYHRMKGFRTSWIPGTDHAAIATQVKVENILYKKEGKTRHDLGRENFLKMVEEYASSSHDTIVHQVKAMGASVDWSREAYTLDDQRNLAVRTAFKQMYDDGLIYRGFRMVNWDPKLQTTVSDEEIEYLEEKSPFYYLQYGPFVIGTSRPETKFGDKYVVMHPDDKRYGKYAHGEKIKLEWINGPVTATIIKDKSVDMSFGTGVMTITPWHDAVDFDISERHGLDKEQIIDFYGKLLPIAGEFAGMHIKKARPLIIEKMKAKGLLNKTEENYVHNVAVNSRGGGMIEPQIKKQWFVGVKNKFKFKGSGVKGIKKGSLVTLQKIMLAMVKSGQVKIMPKRFEKIYYHWVNNLRDWCISRQIWYGHRIPVWYREEEIYCGVNPPNGSGWEQDTDTLDTWFSSGLWTFSVLGWPKNTADFKNYHPMSVMETGYDILPFWVMRMILMSGYLLGSIPFKTVYLHGLVRDAGGRKMSKSLGNMIDPLDMISKYGADATRLSLVIGTAPGNDIKLSEDRVRGYRNFSTKIWNAARFVAMNKISVPKNIKLGKHDKKILADLEKIKKEVSISLEKYDFNRAGEKLYHYFWHTFADKIIESMKPRLQGEDQTDKARAYYTLERALLSSLKLLHPFVPFVTEAAYKKFHPKEILASSKW